MKILAIETSCDETAVAILEISGALEKPDIKVLGNTLLSQIHLHEKYGGVYPNLAKREHDKNLPILLEKVLAEVRSKKLGVRLPEDINFIAVTSGPGLEPALWTGITFAEKLGEKWHKPVIPVNHMEGHIWSVLFQKQDENSSLIRTNRRIELPGLALLVSGGHTELVYIKDFGEYEILGRTRDDAVGEAFDKAARMLGLPYPGGPQISKLSELSRGRRKAIGREFPDADREQTMAFRLPRPMIHSGDLDFSFSGLKTAVLYKLKSEDRTDDEFKEDMARAFEDAAVEVLVEKTRRALRKSDDVKTLIVAGGVSANLHLSRELNKLVGEFPDVILRMPPRLLTTDNAIMIGIAAFIRISRQPEILKNQVKIRAQGNLSIDSEGHRL